MNRVFNGRATAVLASAGHAQNRRHSSPGNWLWQCFTGAEPRSNIVESGLGTSSSSDANEDSVALQAHWCRVYAKVRGQPWMQKGGGGRGRVQGVVCRGEGVHGGPRGKSKGGFKGRGVSRGRGHPGSRSKGGFRGVEKGRESGGR